MNDTTQANATAKTAFGCRNGLATEARVCPLIRCLILLGRVRSSWRCRPPGRGQGVDDRQRGGERRLVLRADPGQDHGEPLGAHRPAAGQHLPARLGDPDLRPPGRRRGPRPGPPARNPAAGPPAASWPAGSPPRGRRARSAGTGPDRSRVASVAAAVRDSPLGGLSQRNSPISRSSPAATSDASARSVRAPEIRPPEISISYLYHFLMYLAIRGRGCRVRRPTLPERFARRAALVPVSNVPGGDAGECHDQAHGRPAVTINLTCIE